MSEESPSVTIDPYPYFIGCAVVIGIVVLIAVTLLVYEFVQSPTFCNLITDLNAQIEAGEDIKDATEEFLDSSPDSLIDDLSKSHQDAAKTFVIAARNFLEAILFELIPSPVEVAIKVYVGTVQDVNQEVCSNG